MLLTTLVACAVQTATPAQPDYDFSAAVALLDAELGVLQGDVAVVVQQSGRDVFRYRAGAIDFDTLTPVASLTKTVSAAVILDLVEEGTLDLERTIGRELPVLFGGGPMGTATLLDCWSMRHGVETRIPYRFSSMFTHGQSVLGIASAGVQVHAPASTLSYEGSGMQVSGWIAVQRTGLEWEALARQRVLGPVGMTDSDYRRFAPNPAVAGGLRSTADEVARFAAMVIAEGKVGDLRILEPSSVEQLFTNHTAGLPVDNNPWPRTHPDYPYGQRPRYGFGDWVLAEDPDTGHVEEVVGVGAWGSHVWIDRRRGLSAAFIVDIPFGTQLSADAALGLYAAARAAVEERQVQALQGEAVAGDQVKLSWEPPAGATAFVVHGADEPILDVFDLRRAKDLRTVSVPRAAVPRFAHYAVVAVLPGGVNEALIPGGNVFQTP